MDARTTSYSLWSNSGIVILDPEGKVVWKGGDAHKGAFFYNTEGKPPIPFADLRTNITPLFDQGLLGGLDVPSNAKPIAKLIKLGNLAGAQALLTRLSGSGPSGEFKEKLVARLEDLRKQKLALFESLASAEKLWEAYKVGDSYVRCFPKAPDLSKIKSAVAALKMKPQVKDNLASQSLFTKVASMAFGSKAKAGADEQAPSLLNKLASKYEGTEFAEYATALAK